MAYPVIVISDPHKYDYSTFVNEVFSTKVSFGLSRIDLVIVKNIENSEDLNSILSKYYYVARKAATSVGYDYSLEINIIFNKFDNQKINSRTIFRNWGTIFKLEEETLQSIPGHPFVVNIKGPKIAIDTKHSNNNSRKIQQFNVAAVGGTFDHIHDGHKILLSVALFLAGKKLIVGVTGAAMLVKKKFAEVLESYSVRQQSVVSFLTLVSIDDSVSYEIYEINDICGPTGFVRDIDALVVSYESIKGGEFVNNYRKERGFSTLDVSVIKVIGEDEVSSDNNWAGKLSSTDIREKESKLL
ncbi:hypothetical protein G9P44_002750 [Scheffersomyces stipitis]|nr:hypothetical protein G9P44_002750 [Scheffersomyces stipitis]